MKTWEGGGLRALGGGARDVAHQYVQLTGTCSSLDWSPRALIPLVNLSAWAQTCGERAAKSGCEPRIATAAWCDEVLYFTRVHGERVLEERTETRKGKRKGEITGIRNVANGAKDWWHLTHPQRTEVAPEEIDR
jgi:hypothetical protein